MAKTNKSDNRKTWLWLPSLYFAEGIPYVMVMTLSVIFYKRMGISNTDIALYTSWLYLPWVIKPLWSPMVDILKTKRWWIILMQLFIGVGLAGVAFTIPLPNFFQYTLAFFWLLAFSSATHDIAADGFYMLGLSKHDQAFFVGIRSTFYRLAMLTGQGLLVILAGHFEAKTGLPPVEVHVSTISEQDSLVFNPGTLQTKTDPTSQYFFTNEHVVISNQKVEKATAGLLIKAIDDWNVQNNFYENEKVVSTIKSEHSWWYNSISLPVKKGLSYLFNPNKTEINLNTTGNVGYTYFYLSKEPAKNEKVILNFSHNSGEKSLSLVKSYRYEFTSKNWNIPAFAAFQVDPKLEKEASAVFVGLSGNISFAWTIVFAIIALIFLAFFVYHRWVLPKPLNDKSNRNENESVFKEFILTFVAFFKKKNIGVILTFLLIYRLGESQLVKLASPFLLDSREMSGLGLTTGDLGFIYGTIGIIALSLGGIIGGICASRKGLKYWMWWMVAAMNLPNLVYVYLSFALPPSLWLVGASVAVEQFGYGFGFTAYMLYMIYVSDGKHQTAHFAITTGFMALGMMIPGMVSGWLQEIVGYQNFFIWVMLCTIPSFIIIPYLKIDPEFGIKTSNTK